MFEKYLRKFGAAVDRRLEPEPEFARGAAVVIPAYGELEYLPDTLDSIAANPPNDLERTLVVVVVNNPVGGGDPAKHAENQAVIRNSRGDWSNSWPRLNLSWIDATAGIGGGVGMARKIGMDAVLPYLKWNDESSLFCLDADTLVPAKYFSSARDAMRLNPGAVAGVFEFRHRRTGDARWDEAIGVYEEYLRYYVDCLRGAGSPYAYHAIGSTICCRAEAYIRSGGMRVREGGEDFYFLQALRKMGGVIDIPAVVEPSARPSDRVPFGTGPRIREIAAGKSRIFHNPAVFAELKAALTVVEKIDWRGFTTLADDYGKLFPAVFAEFCLAAGFAGKWRKIVDNIPKNAAAAKKAFHEWLDAFRTLKFVHFCESEYPGRFPLLISV